MTGTTPPAKEGSQLVFRVGGDDLLPPTGGTPAGSAATITLEDVRIRVGTLLKTETVSFLLGAGASVDCGGQLIGHVPIAVEASLLEQGISRGERPRLARSLKVFYLAIRHSRGGEMAPTVRDSILDRKSKVEDGSIEPLGANLEHVLSQLHRWRAALPAGGGRLRIENDARVDVTAADLEASLRYTTRALAAACQLPTEDKKDGFSTYTTFLRKILTRPLNLKRVNIFTLNYDTLVEQAADAEGVVLLDGFVGTRRRIFRPESYEQDLYFPAETTEGRVHRFDRVVHLYKLHGSVSWVAEEPSIENPYGVSAAGTDPNDGDQRLLIYPTPAKYGETLGMPYSELFRRFAAALVRPQSVLFAVGYGFGDEHVNAIIRQALAVPSFTLVVVDPDPRSDFVRQLRAQKDQRVWIAEGNVATFAGFVDQVLPDLRDEDIRKKVLATQRALVASRHDHEGGDDVDG